MRKIIVAGNWKMNKTASEAKAFFEEFKPLVADVKNAEIISDIAKYNFVSGYRPSENFFIISFLHFYFVP